MKTNQAIRVLLAIPTAGGIHETTSSLAAAWAQRCGVDYIVVPGRPVDYVRNTIIRHFLTGDWTHLFLLDSDTEPPIDGLDRMLATMRGHKASIVTGCYGVNMHNGLRWALARRDTDGSYQLLPHLDSLTEPFYVDAGGAGCLLIKREVFDRIVWPWFRWIEYANGNQMSEDIYFFDKCRYANIPILADPQVRCRHWKTINLESLMVLHENHYWKTKLPTQEPTNVDQNI